MRWGEPNLTGDSFGTGRSPPAAEHGLDMGWPETSRPATLNDVGLNGDWFAMSQPLAVPEEINPSVGWSAIDQPATVVLANPPGNPFAIAPPHVVQQEMNFGREVHYMEQAAPLDLCNSIEDWTDWSGTAEPAATPEQPNPTMSWSGMTPSIRSCNSSFSAGQSFVAGQLAAAPAQTNLAMDLSTITTAGLCNLYSGAQHPLVLGQSLVAPERLDHGMNPWGVGQHFAVQGAYASNDRNSRPKRKAPSSSADTRSDRVRRAKGGSVRENVWITTSGS